MSIYVYNSTISTNTYETVDFGNITSPVDVSIDYSAGLSLQPQSVVDYTTNFYLTPPLPGAPTEFSSTTVTFDSAPAFDSTTVNFSSLYSSPVETIDETYTFDASLYEDFGYLYNNSTLTPMGSLEIELTSATVSQLDHYTASGTLFTVGVLDENVTFAWVGNGTVFEIGSGLERTVRPYIASGTLRMDASVAATALESVTWAYNPSSIYNPQLDWGSVTVSVVGGDDFSLITEQPLGSSPFDDFGLVANNPTSYPQLPFGRFRFVNYTADNNYDTCDNDGIPCDNQSSANISFTANTPDETILYDFSGILVESETDAYVGVGTLILLGTSLESETDVYVGLGTLIISSTSLESETDAYVGVGTLTFSGTALESFSAQTPEDTSLYTFLGTALESFSAQTPEDTQLFSISGELVHPNIDYTPHYGIEKNIGVGTTGIQLKAGVFPERFTFSYNEDSPCYDSIAESLDFGLLTGTPIVPITLPNSDFIDHGLVSEEETGNIPDNFGWITEPLVVTCPFGSVFFSGTALESFSAQTPEDTALYTFLGTALESFSAQTPEDTALYTFLGTAIEKHTESYVGVGTLTFSGTAVEKHTESYVGVGTLTFSGTALESFSAQTPEDTQLFIVSGTALESFSANTPEDTQLFSISGTVVEKHTESYVGVGTLTFSGTALESFSAQTPEDTSLYTFLGTVLESFSANTPEDTQLFSISGTAVEKHTESYVGIGILTLSGTALESFSAQTPEDTALYTFLGTALESFSAQTPEDIVLYTLSGSLIERNTESYVGVGTFGPVPGVGFAPDGDGNLRDAKTYSNRYGFLIGDFNLGSGIGTIRLLGNGRTRYIPIIFGQGSIFVSGTGNESFSKCNYDGSGIITLSGIASTREIAVYGYYGDDNNPGTSGTIFISQQTSPIVEKETDSYLGFGQLTVSGSSDILITNSFRGSGTVQFYGTALESFSAQTPEDIQLFNISGFSLEVYSAQTPETEVLYIINGFIEESITNSYEGLGSISLTGDSTTFYVPNYPARGTFRFTRHDVDNDYDTCDNEDIVCDNQDSAYVSFTVNPPENTVPFNINGSAVTAEISVYTGIGVGLYTLSGTYESIKFTYSEIGIGTAFISEISSETETNVYIGNGDLFTLSGSAESVGVIPPENILHIQISGSAVTSIEFEYSIVGIGLFDVSGSAITSEIATYTQIGSGTITLSGELLYPDVVYIPSPDGFGLINVLGSAENSITRVYDNTSGSLFGFSSGLESFAKSTYIGVGTIYIQELSGLTINNPFQIPRTYVVII